MAAIIATLVVVAGAVAVVLVVGGDEASRGEPAAADDDADAAAIAATTSVGNPSQAFAVAVRQLEEGGSFRYEGTVHADEATALRPTTVFSEPVAVEGEVALPHRVHERATDGDDTVHETTIVGPGFWEPTSGGEGRRGPAMGMGAALLPRWLQAVTDRTAVDSAEADDLGADEDARVFAGTLALDEVGGALDVAIALDPDDVLTHVWITGDGAPFSLDWEISRIGDQLDIPAPGPLPDVAIGFGPEELAAAGIERPVHITQVPHGWVLAEVWIQPHAPRGDCSTLNLNYQPVDDPLYADERSTQDFVDVPLELDVMAAACTPTEPLGDPFGVGGFTGEAVDKAESWNSRTTGRLSDGVTTIKFESGLPLTEVEVLLGSLAPFDPEVAPTER